GVGPRALADRCVVGSGDRARAGAGSRTGRANDVPGVRAGGRADRVWPGQLRPDAAVGADRGCRAAGGVAGDTTDRATGPASAAREREDREDAPGDLSPVAAVAGRSRDRVRGEGYRPRTRPTWT